jgi:two-component sensor histidine kinase
MDGESSGGFGLRLVGMLAEQMGASLRIENRGGTSYELVFDHA